MKLPRFRLPSLPFDRDDGLKVLAVLLVSMLIWWSSIVLGVAVRLFELSAGLR